MNDALQAIGVAIIVVFAIAWIVRKSRKKDSACNCGCSDCELSRVCKKRDIEKK